MSQPPTAGGASRCDRLATAPFAWSRRHAAREEGRAENAKDAARYRYLRGDGRNVMQPAYEPEGAGVWGGEDLNELCDAGIAQLSVEGAS